jgi:hypothetical protein
MKMARNTHHVDCSDARSRQQHPDTMTPTCWLASCDHQSGHNNIKTIIRTV